MKRLITFGKPVILLVLVFGFIFTTGCGGGGVEGAVATISGFTTSAPKDVSVKASDSFFGFSAEAAGDRYGYRIGYAVVENGVRTDHIIYTFTPTPNDDFKNTTCSFVLSGNFFDEYVKLQHIQSGDGWSYVGDTTQIHLPILSGFTILTRPNDFEHLLLFGDDLVIASVIGATGNEVLRPTTLDVFDQYRTIDEALTNPSKADRPFLLIFFITAIQT